MILAQAMTLSESSRSKGIRTEVDKDFGSLRAVDGLDLQINPGELFCFLGPNGRQDHDHQDDHRTSFQPEATCSLMGSMSTRSL